MDIDIERIGGIMVNVDIRSRPNLQDRADLDPETVVERFKRFTVEEVSSYTYPKMRPNVTLRYCRRETE